MKIKIMSNKRNELLDRNEVIFMVSHEKDPTPLCIGVRENLANALQVDVNRVYIKRIKTITGTTTAIGEAHVYDSPEKARTIESKHIIIRNTPQKKGGEK
ncbi:MAG: 30S ribosomal protein S24e [Candidatus Bathyarchaeia archaeon]